MLKNRTISSYKDLIVWQKSIDLVITVYAFTEKFPTSEMYGLTSQMRRAAVAIPSNIADGTRRGSRKDYRQFLLYSYGSGSELETQLVIAKKLPFSKSLDSSSVENLLSEIMRMLNKLIQAIRP